MGQDIRAKNLPKISESDWIKYYKSLRIALDAPAYANTKSVLFYNLFKTSRVVSADSNVSTKMLTPKAYLATVATYIDYGIVRAATEDDIVNNVVNLVFDRNNGKVFDNQVITINESNRSTYFEYAGDCIATLINIKYLRKDNIVYINGQVKLQPLVQSPVIGLYFKNIPLPVCDTTGSGFNNDSYGNYVDKVTCRCRVVSGYLLEVGLHTNKFGYSSSSEYYTTFSTSYIYTD